MSSAEAAQKAVDALNKQDLDGRSVIIEIAKPADQKDKERNERKANRRPGRRGSKAVPGEVTEAEADGDVPKAEDTPAAEDEADKPKKKKKNAVSKFASCNYFSFMSDILSSVNLSARLCREMLQSLLLQTMLLLMSRAKTPPVTLQPRNVTPGSAAPLVRLAQLVKTLLASPLRQCFLSPT